MRIRKLIPVLGMNQLQCRRESRKGTPCRVPARAGAGRSEYRRYCSRKATRNVTQEQPPKSRRATIIAYAQVLAHIIAWPLIVLSAPIGGLSVYLAIVRGVDGRTVRDTIVGSVEFVVVAHLVALLLVGVSSGFRSRVLIIGACVSVILIIFCFGLTFLGFLQAR